MSAPVVRLTVDASALSDALDELSQFPERLLEIFELLVDGPLGIAELGRVDTNLGFAGGAGECRIALQPSKRLRDLLVALRA
ncbi:hypothetical protein [Burkholderia ambifaria]|uniref:hypothetical protein n=1 Tax=Burkholderia ambifaria TaxID=152480 RepID=UPI00158DF845|nr:hypothetical protein [Burkholderia ambifaria]